ncbi:hypothetical protein SELMODRAFT_176538 [Selaginella moellendorffii]|uniref:DUF1308 domain-containing protein n=1 Tax=Selaginella moellendorffii TaxID=88036 RepID=D8S3C9_SELML|nr:uncharacterized protein LOC9657555 [Selaginella moellendorffii]EFJ21241.1 hypothetical protein SELMODRAFT_176538 [Selaginella moellendorffii]|eukprot:XP_002977903.1 uncharacterized protein LOC9657555 [Selaginella moellendorffii]
MDLGDELLRARVGAARTAIEALSVGKIMADCRRSLSKLGALEERSGPPDSSNFGHFEALIQLLQHPYVSGICGVNKSFLGSPSSRAHVDLVGMYDGKPAWMVVSDRNPKHVSWPELRSRAEILVQAAVANPVTRPDFLIFYFARGVERGVAESFKSEFSEYQIEVDDLHKFSEVEAGEWLLVDEDQEEESLSSSWISLPVKAAVMYRLKVAPASVFEGEVINANEYTESIVGIVEHGLEESGFYRILKDVSRDWGGRSERVELVNLDTTALIGLVCGISNGVASSLAWCSVKQLQKKYSSFGHFFKTQALLELERPFLREVAMIFKERQPMVSQFAWKEFDSIVSVIGGPDEQRRAAALHDCLKPFIVPDNPSERVMALPQTGRIHGKHKIVFGTGDSSQAPTLTSNISFVRAAIAKGMALGFIEHRPLALTRD